MKVTSCAFCQLRPQYQDRRTGQYVCLEHARLEVVAAGQHTPAQPLAVRPATPVDYPRIEELSLYFWDETDVDCFDRQYAVLGCPAFLAFDGDDAGGLVSYAIEADLDAVVVVMLNVLPILQGRGVGHALLDAVCGEGRRQGMGRTLVATSNDDLPALALYQRFGFHIAEIIPGRIAQKHGSELPGFSGIAVRDEIRLECRLAW